MKCILINLGGEQGSGEEYNILDRYSPLNNLGIQYVGNALQKQGHDVTILDAAVSPMSDNQILERMKEINPGFVGFSPYFHNRKHTSNLVDKVKKQNPRTHVSVGGHDATWHVLENLERYSADSIIRGEGEIVTPELVHRLEEGKSIEGLEGVCPRDSKRRMRVNETFAETPNLTDCYPMLDLSSDITGIDTSRGCYRKGHGCDFCTTPGFFTMGWREYPLDNVKEVISQYAKNGVRKFSLNDDNFAGSSRLHRERADEIISTIEENGGKITYSLVHAASIIAAEREGYLDRWSKTLIRTLLGAESPHPCELENLGKKGNTAKTSLKAIRALKDRGVCTQVGLIPFNPWTKLEYLEGYSDWLNQADETSYWLNFAHCLRPYPHTPIKDRIRKAGFLLAEGEEELSVHGAFGYRFEQPEAGKLARIVSDIARTPLISKTDQLGNLSYLYLADKGLGKFVPTYCDLPTPRTGYSTEILDFLDTYRNIRKKMGRFNVECFNQLLESIKNGNNHESIVKKYLQEVERISPKLEEQYDQVQERHPLGGEE